MRAKLEDTKNIEDVIRETADEVQEECLDEMIMLAEQLRKRKENATLFRKNSNSNYGLFIL